MKCLTNAMLKPRKAKLINGRGMAWFYVSHGGLEVYTANEEGAPSKQTVFISSSQLRRALEITTRPQMIKGLPTKSW